MYHDIEKMYLKHPEKLKEALKIIFDKDQELVKHALHRADLGHHLDEDMMHEALASIIRYDGVKAPFWTHEEFRELLAKKGISLVYEKFNDYDMDYLAQYYFADFKSLGKEPGVFIDLAKDTLTDIDNPKACEAAYWRAYRRINGDH